MSCCAYQSVATKATISVRLLFSALQAGVGGITGSDLCKEWYERAMNNKRGALWSGVTDARGPLTTSDDDGIIQTVVRGPPVVVEVA